MEHASIDSAVARNHSPRPPRPRSHAAVLGARQVVGATAVDRYVALGSLGTVLFVVGGATLLHGAGSVDDVFLPGLASVGASLALFAFARRQVLRTLAHEHEERGVVPAEAHARASSTIERLTLGEGTPPGTRTADESRAP